MTIASALRPLSHVGAGRGSAGKMSAPREPGRDSEAAFAKRIDPAREPELSAEQRRVMQRAEEALRRRGLQRRLRGRNLLTGLGIGAVALGIYGFTFYKISQERFLDELEQEVEAARAQAAKTPVN
ncbi:cytochrome c oxidase assembly factor 3 homolog, mitochondrial [Gopherus evgoodei]|uniref:cytochrome c oxidase assembly factor 3 homolog, mitochondrial n=1 Tax=Gopherus evgoodei TaxID=1825980 RepID=UPI0011CEE252|nr:cytochrome c oxidase assembly factor 3 homolog, mitochondrial [Gopherus evgoodei]